MDEREKKIYEVLSGLTAEQVIGAFLDYHGTQLLDDGFAKHLVDEGLCSEADVGLEDESEDDDEELS